MYFSKWSETYDKKISLKDINEDSFSDVEKNIYSTVIEQIINKYELIQQKS